MVRTAAGVSLASPAAATTEKVADAAVTSEKLADGAVTSVKLAGVAATGGTQLLSYDAQTASTTPVQLDSFTVNVPGPGTLTITVAGFFWVDADAGGATAITRSAELALCDTTAAFDACGGAHFEAFVQDPDNASSDNATPAFSLTRSVAVAAAGNRTFFLNGAVANVSDTLHLWGHDDGGVDDGTKGPIATVVFTPGALTVTRP